MKYKAHFLFLSFVLLLALRTHAQELNLDVKVNAVQLQTVDPVVIENLETTINDFMNLTNWTNDEYESHERIEGALIINITKELSPTTFEADIYITTSRPVYNSSYYSQVLNIADKKAVFQFEQFQPLSNSRSNFVDNLSSILTFYAYIILGFDYDSFAPMGGDSHFQAAQSILSSIPTATKSLDNNWASSGNKRNRYLLIENLFDARVKPFRQAFYEYHRQSLDVMYKDPNKARAIMSGTIASISAVNRVYNNSMIIQMFLDSKRNEVIEIFSGGNRSETKKIYDTMTSMDPSNLQAYNSLR